MKKRTADSVEAVNERFRALISGLSSRTAALVFAVAFCGLLGTYFLTASHAATPAVSVEPESGTRSTNASLVTDTTASGSSAVKFSASGTVTCATSTPNVPDGPDGMGGCFPGPNNTGPNAPESSMTAYTGSCTVNTANVTIDSKIINCAPLTVGSAAANLMIKNSYLKGGVVQNGSASFTIQDSQIDNAVNRPACSSGTTCAAGKYACGDLNNGTVDCGVNGGHFTLLRIEVLHTNRGAYCETTCTIQDSYFHGTNLWPDASDGAHASGVRNEQYLTLRHNSLACDYQGPFTNDEIGCSADMSGYPDFVPIMHDTIDSNLFIANPIGFYFCAYGGGTAGKPYSNDPNNATYIVFTNNVFQRGSGGVCGITGGGPITDFKAGRTGNVWSGNKYDNGVTVPSG
jgi:hypothetical protein